MHDAKDGPAVRTGEVRFGADFGHASYKVFAMEEAMLGSLEAGGRCVCSPHNRVCRTRLSTP